MEGTANGRSSEVCDPAVMSHHEFPAGEWADGVAEGAGPAEWDPGEPTVIPGATAPAPRAAQVVSPKNFCLGLAMGLAMLASQRPLIFAWLVHEALAFVPVLVLAYGLTSLARFERTFCRSSAQAWRGAVLLMAVAAVVAVSGVPDGWPGF